jgi:glucose-6-phosphate 1-dehydrogenase
MVQNMIVMRFGNTFFERMWDRNSIDSVQITFKEDFGTMGRGGYFDNYGIIRDILQNHLMQVLALVAMEKPAAVFGASAGGAVRDAKTAIIKKIRPIALEDVVLRPSTSARPRCASSSSSRRASLRPSRARTAPATSS